MCGNWKKKCIETQSYDFEVGKKFPFMSVDTYVYTFSNTNTSILSVAL